MEADQEISKKSKFAKTRLALVWMKVVDEPFVCLYALMSFILRKDLHATAFELSLFVTIRPLMSLFSFYWGMSFWKKKLTNNLMAAWILARLPFLFFPFFNSIYYVIVSCAIYQLFYRAGLPALMEILKQNIEGEKREKTYSFVFVLGFLESVVIGLFIGKILDLNIFSNWKLLFSVFSMLSITSIIFQRKIPTVSEEKSQKSEDKQKSFAKTSFAKIFLKPLHDCIYLMRKNKNFFNFQMGFMFGGIGLMLIAPALAIYYVEDLKLTHEKISVARYVWMGLGIILSTYFWQRAISKKILFNKLLCFILLGFSSFSIILLFAKYNLFWLDIAFLVYGISQAGSHLLWNLSGTIFSNDDQSSITFTGINVLMVGIRGAIFPFIGGVLCTIFGVQSVLVFGFSICFMGFLYLFRKSFFIKAKKIPLPNS
jgi:MFS family permease